MKWFGKKRTTEPGSDEPRDKQEAEARLNPMFGSIALEEVGDLLPGGYGPIGSITNPIPVNGIIGEKIYLNQLRSPNDEGYCYHRPGSRKVDISANPIDGFELFSLDGQDRRTVWLSPYHPYRSTLAPEGCFLRVYPRGEREQVFVRTPAHGVTTRVSSFPHDLPAALEQSKALANIAPGLGAIMARNVSAALAKQRLPERQHFAPGPVDIGVQENEHGYVVFMLDSTGSPIDTGIVRHGATRKELDADMLEMTREGKQTLIVYALLDEMNLTVEERQTMERELCIPSSDLPNFALHFSLCWLSHELQGRPRADGTFGSTVPSVRTTHWADLPHPPRLMTRAVREILDAVADRRG